MAIGMLLPAQGWADDSSHLPAWRLVWSDEFDRSDGSAPDPGKWTYDLGGHGWGNSELQTYTSRRQNARIENGKLVIEARRENFTGTDGRPRAYTSARLKTYSKASWTYGRFEARIQVPEGQGLWPAFWMLGTDIGKVGWPQCGELDIMENIGREPSVVHGTAHGPGYSGGSGLSGSLTLAGGQRFSDDFHLFALEWEPDRLRWSVDNRIYFTAGLNNLPRGTSWVFNKPQYLLLNVAVGGNWPGVPNSSTVFPQMMVVDYVRVYERTNAPTPVLRVARQNGQVTLCWPELFPQAQIQYSPTATGPWTTVDFNRERGGGEFIAEVSNPGCYRLRILP